MAFTKQEILRIIQDLQDQADSLVKQGDYKLADQRLKRIKELKEQLKHMKDSMEVLKLSGFTVDAIKYSFDQLVKASWTTWEHIVNNPGKYDPSTVAEAQKLLNTKKRFFNVTGKDAYSFSNYKDDPRHERTVKSIENEIGKYKRRIENNRIRLAQSPNREEQKEYESNQMKIKQLVSMLQRAKGQKDGDIILPQHEASDDDATKEGAIKEYGKEKGSFEDACNKDECGGKVYTKGTEDAERSVTWVKPSEINYKIGDIIQFKGKNVKVTKITGNVVEAQVMDACSNKDSDPKIAEAEALINLCGGVK